MSISKILIHDIEIELSKIKTPEFISFSVWEEWNDNTRAKINLSLKTNDYFSNYSIRDLLPATITVSLKRDVKSILKDVERKLLPSLPALFSEVERLINQSKEHDLNLAKNKAIFENAGHWLKEYSENVYHIDNDYRKKLKISSNTEYCELTLYGLDESQLKKLATFLASLK